MSERNAPADDLGWLPDAPATGFLLDRGHRVLSELMQAQLQWHPDPEDIVPEGTATLHGGVARKAR